jgi:CRISPR-associated protein Cmr6
VPEPRLTGPLAAVVGVRDRGGNAQDWEFVDRAGHGGLETANALLLFRRALAYHAGGGAEHDAPGDGPAKLDDTAALRWAVGTWLGQRAEARTRDARKRDAKLVELVHARRRAAMESLRRVGLDFREVRLEPATPVVIGAAEAGVREMGISLHGTYGWPVLPGSGLKGAAHAVARDWGEQDLLDRVFLFGGPRAAAAGEDETAAAAEQMIGLVAFLDALPAPQGVPVTRAVLTPHAGPYYRDLLPPAEYWNPVPVPFLTISGGQWTAFVLGDPDFVEDAARLVGLAAAELGLGAKTAAGYGYLTATQPGPDHVADSTEAADSTGTAP